MPELLNHDHCKVCNRAVPFGNNTCGKTCADQYSALQKKRARTVLLFYGGGAFLIMLLVLQLVQSF